MTHLSKNQVRLTTGKNKFDHCFLNKLKGKVRHSPSLSLSFSSAHLAGAQLCLIQKFLNLSIFTNGIYIKVLMPPSETINHEKIVKENHET